MIPVDEDAARQTAPDPGHMQEITASVVIGVALLVIVFLLYGPDRLGEDALALVGASSGAGIAVVVVRYVANRRGVTAGSAMLSLVAWGAIFQGGRGAPPAGPGATYLLRWMGGSTCPIGTANVPPGELCWDLSHVTLVSFLGAALLGVMAFLIQVGVPVLILRSGKATAERMIGILLAAVFFVGPVVGLVVGESASLVASALASVGAVDAAVTTLALVGSFLSFALVSQPPVQIALLGLILVVGILRWRRRRAKK